MASSMQPQWHQEVSEDMRKQIIMEMYHELMRIASHEDRQRVWGSAAKFELTLWTTSTDRTAYLTKMQRKIARLRQKPPLAQPQPKAEEAVAPQQPPQNMMQADQAVAMNSNGGVGEQHVPQQTATSVAAPVLPPTPTPTPVTRGLMPQQRQTQQWLQRLQLQFQAQLQQLLHMHQQETQQLHRQQLAQTQQLMQQHQQQRVPEELRRQQLHQLHQQHELTRVSLQQLQTTKLQEIRLKQQQYLLQKRQNLHFNLQTITQQPTASQPAQMEAAVTREIKPEQLQAAHEHQARMRDMQRTKNSADMEREALAHATLGVSTPQQQQRQMHQSHQVHAQEKALAQAQARAQLLAQAPESASKVTHDQKPSLNQVDGAVAADASYWERHGVLKAKHWDDVVVVYKEFERLMKQKPAGPQLEQIKKLLNTLRQIVAFFLQEPAKAKNCDKNDLNRVEACIQKQVLPLLHRLQEKKRRSESLANNEGAVGSIAASEVVASPNQAAIAALAAQRAQHEAMNKLQEAQRMALLQQQQEQKKKQEVEVAAAEVKKQQEVMELARKRKLQQQQQQDRVRQQQQDQLLATEARHKQLIMQQQAAMKAKQQHQQQVAPTAAILDETTLKQESPSTPTLDVKTASPHASPVVKATVANADVPATTPKTEVPSAGAVEFTETSVVTSPEAEANENPHSVVPDLTGLSPSEKLVTAVAALEKNKSDVLRRSSERFARVAIAVGAKLCTAYEVSA